MYAPVLSWLTGKWREDVLDSASESEQDRKTVDAVPEGTNRRLARVRRPKEAAKWAGGDRRWQITSVGAT
jgi:hypothetical protein